MLGLPITIPPDAIERPLRMFGVPDILATAIGEVARAILGADSFASALRAAQRAGAAAAAETASEATLDALMKSDGPEGPKT